MKLHRITSRGLVRTQARSRVLEAKPSHPNNPNITQSNQADTQAKARAKTSAERDAQLDQERQAEKGPEAKDTKAERDAKGRQIVLKKLQTISAANWTPQNQTLGRLLTQLLEPATVRQQGGK